MAMEKQKTPIVGNKEAPQPMVESNVTEKLSLNAVAKKTSHTEADLLKLGGAFSNDVADVYASRKPFRKPINII